MLMRELVGDRYIHLEDNECFDFIWHYLDSWADGQVQQNLLLHLPPGHFRTTLALTMALHLAGRYAGRRIAYLVADREAVSALIDLTERLLSLRRMRFIFPRLSYQRKSRRFLFLEGGTLDFHVFGSPFNAEDVDTIILDEPQKPDNARVDWKAAAAQQYVRQNLLSTRRKKQILLINSLMSMNDIAVAFGVEHSSVQVHKGPMRYEESLQLVWQSVTTRPITYSMPRKTWDCPEYHILCEELCPFSDQIDILRQVGSVEFISRYLQMPLGKPDPYLPELPAQVLRNLTIAQTLEFVFQMRPQSPKIYEVIHDYFEKYPSAEI
ncbi:hypothetical protein [Methylocella sp. CPCC 101449]|uniref:hypothetical protein n=1 Tax=Methylocella sp. CPCC 101449 TaxID=2987531 RepID=UPI0028911122|nr:hypothetical protein [Methylocella sp. CPCC 101449]MDT2019478.1 hypothetical protein [Methylocella sp. CPCC 101449]